MAEVAAIALLEDRLLFGTLELCAQGGLTRKDVAALMGAVLGHEIKAESFPPKPAAQGAPAEEKQAVAMESLLDWYDHHGLLGNPLILQAILDLKLGTLCAYFEDQAAEVAR